MNARIDFDQILPKTLVHKWSIDQVLLTSYVQQSRTETLLGAQLPRSHGLYCENMTENRNPDIAALIEICRQSCFVIAHTQFEVPLSGNHFQFLFQELEATTFPTQLTSKASNEPTVKQPILIVASSAVEREWKRGTGTSGLSWNFKLRTRDELDLGNVRIQQTWIERAKWKEMRGVMRRGRGLPPQPTLESPPDSELRPSEVARSNPQNVVLQRVHKIEDRYEAVARVDIRHPVLFDHSIDHIYAMVQTEASRQLALYAAADVLDVTAFDLEVGNCIAKFISVGEFDVETKLVATVSVVPNGLADVTVVISQNDRTVSRFSLNVRPVVPK
ncbi:AfsA-related hotdog domain-containing protein [Paraburkholderia phenazinium]|uniref:AfsA-related hotdog domain-containing protein n=1 Tax=Paraburkholderia phenazinium TaxID=60549 RepID=UPI00158DCE07|nr:AfsA-related hotdog domain-containing protein [Paraburkholderia phenazinium]